MKKAALTIMLVVMLGFATQANAGLSVTDSTDGNALASSILGSGITISNVSFTGSATQSGFFTGGFSSGLSIDKGILLTSGDAANAIGPNNSDGITGVSGTGSDADLAGLIPGYTTYDKNILSFDFESTGGDVFFNYVFASDEYTEYVHSSYNDVFGFFLDGQNIALLPDGVTPVSVNNVNNIDNSALFNLNDPSFGTPPFNIQYDGFTVGLTAKKLGLTAGKHHIKLAISDAGDTVLDSGVFIEGGSFSDTETEPGEGGNADNVVPEPMSLLLLGSGLVGIFLRKRV